MKFNSLESCSSFSQNYYCKVPRSSMKNLEYHDLKARGEWMFDLKNSFLLQNQMYKCKDKFNKYIG